MKKSIVCLGGFFLASALAFGQTMKITSPSGGEFWPKGVYTNITWTYSGIQDNTKVKLILFKNGAKVDSIVTGVSIGSGGHGAWDWKSIGAHAGGTAAVGGGYSIRIRTMDNGPFADSALFTIYTITFTSPQTNDSWILGSSHTVAWTFGGIPAGTLVDLFLEQAVMWNVPLDKNISIGSGGSGSWDWEKAGSYIGGTAKAVGQYHILLRHSYQGLAQSPPFTFSAPPLVVSDDVK